MLDGNVLLRQKRDEVLEGTLSCPDRNLADFSRHRHYEGLYLLLSTCGKVLIQQTLIKETATKLRTFADTHRYNFNENESESLYVGIIARCLQDGLDPTVENNRTTAMKSIYNTINWRGAMSTTRDCCDSWTQIFATRMNVETNVVDSMKSVIADMCLSDHYVSLMGSNGAAHTLTHWDGSHVNGLGAQTKKKGKSL